MKFWYFHFDGYFSADSAEYPEEGVISSCLVPAANYLDAEFGFLQALAERKINLIEISESFPVDTEDMDLEDPNNMYWIEWCEETEMAEKPTFEAFNLYPQEEVVKPPKDN